MEDINMHIDNGGDAKSIALRLESLFQGRKSNPELAISLKESVLCLDKLSILPESSYKAKAFQYLTLLLASNIIGKAPPQRQAVQKCIVSAVLKLVSNSSTITLVNTIPYFSLVFLVDDSNISEKSSELTVLCSRNDSICRNSMGEDVISRFVPIPSKGVSVDSSKLLIGFLVACIRGSVNGCNLVVTLEILKKVSLWMTSLSGMCQILCRKAETKEISLVLSQFLIQNRQEIVSTLQKSADQFNASHGSGCSYVLPSQYLKMRSEADLSVIVPFELRLQLSEFRCQTVSVASLRALAEPESPWEIERARLEWLEVSIIIAQAHRTLVTFSTTATSVSNYQAKQGESATSDSVSALLAPHQHEALIEGFRRIFQCVDSNCKDILHSPSAFSAPEGSNGTEQGVLVCPQYVQLMRAYADAQRVAGAHMRAFEAGKRMLLYAQDLIKVTEAAISTSGTSSPCKGQLELDLAVFRLVRAEFHAWAAVDFLASKSNAADIVERTLSAVIAPESPSSLSRCSAEIVSEGELSGLGTNSHRELFSQALPTVLHARSATISSLKSVIQSVTEALAPVLLSLDSHHSSMLALNNSTPAPQNNNPTFTASVRVGLSALSHVLQAAVRLRQWWALRPHVGYGLSEAAFEVSYHRGLNSLISGRSSISTRVEPPGPPKTKSKGLLSSLEPAGSVGAAPRKGRRVLPSEMEDGTSTAVTAPVLESGTKDEQLLSLPELQQLRDVLPAAGEALQQQPLISGKDDVWVLLEHLSATLAAKTAASLPSFQGRSPLSYASVMAPEDSQDANVISGKDPIDYTLVREALSAGAHASGEAARARLIRLHIASISFPSSTAGSGNSAANCSTHVAARATWAAMRAAGLIEVSEGHFTSTLPPSGDASHLSKEVLGPSASLVSKEALHHVLKAVAYVRSGAEMAYVVGGSTAVPLLSDATSVLMGVAVPLVNACVEARNLGDTAVARLEVDAKGQLLSSARVAAALLCSVCRVWEGWWDSLPPGVFVSQQFLRKNLGKVDDLKVEPRSSLPESLALLADTLDVARLSSRYTYLSLALRCTQSLENQSGPGERIRNSQVGITISPEECVSRSSLWAVREALFDPHMQIFVHQQWLSPPEAVSFQTMSKLAKLTKKSKDLEGTSSPNSEPLSVDALAVRLVHPSPTKEAEADAEERFVTFLCSRVVAVLRKSVPQLLESEESLIGGSEDSKKANLRLEELLLQDSEAVFERTYGQLLPLDARISREHLLLLGQSVFSRALAAAAVSHVSVALKASRQRSSGTTELKVTPQRLAERWTEVLAAVARLCLTKESVSRAFLAAMESSRALSAIAALLDAHSLLQTLREKRERRQARRLMSTGSPQVDSSRRGNARDGRPGLAGTLQAIFDSSGRSVAHSDTEDTGTDSDEEWEEDEGEEESSPKEIDCDRPVTTRSACAACAAASMLKELLQLFSNNTSPTKEKGQELQDLHTSAALADSIFAAGNSCTCGGSFEYMQSADSLRELLRTCAASSDRAVVLRAVPALALHFNEFPTFIDEPSTSDTSVMPCNVSISPNVDPIRSIFPSLSLVGLLRPLIDERAVSILIRALSPPEPPDLDGGLVLPAFDAQGSSKGNQLRKKAEEWILSVLQGLQNADETISQYLSSVPHPSNRSKSFIEGEKKYFRELWLGLAHLMAAACIHRVFTGIRASEALLHHLSSGVSSLQAASERHLRLQFSASYLQSNAGTRSSSMDYVAHLANSGGSLVHPHLLQLEKCWLALGLEGLGATWTQCGDGARAAFALQGAIGVRNSRFASFNNFVTDGNSPEKLILIAAGLGTRRTLVMHLHSLATAGDAAGAVFALLELFRLPLIDVQESVFALCGFLHALSDHRDAAARDSQLEPDTLVDTSTASSELSLRVLMGTEVVMEPAEGWQKSLLSLISSLVGVGCKGNSSNDRKVSPENYWQELLYALLRFRRLCPLPFELLRLEPLLSTMMDWFLSSSGESSMPNPFATAKNEGLEQAGRALATFSNPGIAYEGIALAFTAQLQVARRQFPDATGTVGLEAIFPLEKPLETALEAVIASSSREGTTFNDGFGPSFMCLQRLQRDAASLLSVSLGSRTLFSPPDEGEDVTIEDSSGSMPLQLKAALLSTLAAGSQMDLLLLRNARQQLSDGGTLQGALTASLQVLSASSLSMEPMALLQLPQLAAAPWPLCVLQREPLSGVLGLSRLAAVRLPLNALKGSKSSRSSKEISETLCLVAASLPCSGAGFCSATIRELRAVLTDSNKSLAQVTLSSTPTTGTKAGKDTGGATESVLSGILRKANAGSGTMDKDAFWSARAAVDERMRALCERIQETVFRNSVHSASDNRIQVDDTLSKEQDMMLRTVCDISDPKLLLSGFEDSKRRVVGILPLNGVLPSVLSGNSSAAPISSTDSLISSSSSEWSEEALMSMKLTDLRGLAAKEGLKLPASMKKADVAAAIWNHLKPSVKDRSNKDYSGALAISARSVEFCDPIGKWGLGSAIPVLPCPLLYENLSASSWSVLAPHLTQNTTTNDGNCKAEGDLSRTMPPMTLLIAPELLELPLEGVPMFRKNLTSIEPPSRIPSISFLMQAVYACEAILSRTLQGSSNSAELRASITRVSERRARFLLSPLSHYSAGNAAATGGCCPSSTMLHYMINPTGDLSRTETTFQNYFDSRTSASSKGLLCPCRTCSASHVHSDAHSHAFRGSLGLRARLDSLEDLESASAYVFCGHGAGESRIPRELISKSSQGLPVTMLMGCSSARIAPTVPVSPFTMSAASSGLASEEMENVEKNAQLAGKRFALSLPDGGILRYLSVGSIVVGALWDVTDIDIDRFSMNLLDNIMGYNDIKPGETPLILGDIGSHIALDVAKCRDTCKMKYIIGAAPVVYGLVPINWIW